MAATIRGKRIRIPHIPVFRVFYSLTYTLLYLVTLVFLGITPVSMIYGSIQQSALQYTAMIGAAYFLLAIFAIFIYSSRIYTNRSILSAVGKAYIPIEDGEISKMVRKMIVKQLERSAIVAWESRPRDLYGEIMLAEQEGILPPETSSVNREAYTVGTEIRVDPQNPPWGDVQHPGWSSPSHSRKNNTPEVQFDTVIAELPHLIEAQAVSLAPPDPLLTPVPGEGPVVDLAVVNLLKRPANMAVREYLMQLSYLGLVPEAAGQSFLSQYEEARFSGKPVAVDQFNSLMSAFSDLLAGFNSLDPVIIDEIRAQSEEKQLVDNPPIPILSLPLDDTKLGVNSLSPPMLSPYSANSSNVSPVTAREAQSPRVTTPYVQQSSGSEESLGSVVHASPYQAHDFADAEPTGDLFDRSPSFSASLPSDTGSVLRHDIDGND